MKAPSPIRRRGQWSTVVVEKAEDGRAAIAGVLQILCVGRRLDLRET